MIGQKRRNEMDNLQKYKERFEKIKQMNLTIAEKDRAIGKLMTTIEKENGGINEIISRKNEITDFYLFIRDERRF